MKLTVKEIRKIPKDKSLIKVMPDRLACNTARNLTSYVNTAYPVEGYKYGCHITKENAVQISLVPNM